MGSIEKPHLSVQAACEESFSGFGDSFTATGSESDPCFCHGVFAVMRPLNLTNVTYLNRMYHV